MATEELSKEVIPSSPLPKLDTEKKAAVLSPRTERSRPSDCTMALWRGSSGRQTDRQADRQAVIRVDTGSQTDRQS